MGDVKSELKSARELIKQKEYKEALKHCKNVLKADKNNYNGLVFIGVCATELEQYDQAKQAYRKAIDVNTDHILAWQGLCTCIEKANNDLWRGELIDAYTTLLEKHVKENEKWCEYCAKLVEVLKMEKQYDVAVRWLKQSIEKQSSIPSIVSQTNELILLLKEWYEDSPERGEEVLSDIMVQYQKFLELCEDNGNSCALEYLQFISQFARIEYNRKPSLGDAVDIAQKMHERFPDNADVEEIFCLFWIYHNVENCSLNDRISQSATSLKEVKPSSYITHLLSGLQECSIKNIAPAKACFQKACSARSNDAVALYFSSKCQFELHQYKLAGEHVRTALAACSKLEFKETDKALKKLLLVLHAEILLLGPKTDKQQREISLYMEKLDDSYADQVDVVLLKIKVAVMMNETERALKLLSDLEGFPIPNTSLQCELLHIKALVSMKEGNYFDAEVRLLESLEIMEKAHTHFLLGEVYMSIAKQGDNQSYYPKVYNSFLKAAKLDPYYPVTFLRLGEYQRDHVRDLNKSAKCLEKALSLDTMNDDIVRCLGDVYLQLDQTKKAVDLFDNFTAKSASGSAIWAWMRLGLLNLKTNADRAVVCFQHAIRGGSSVSHYWECLAEAYFHKGSFTSALKAFNKALELDPSSVFCKFKVAKIKQMLSMDTEAIEVYEDVLRTSPAYVPALLGLAETHLHIQKEKLKATLDGGAVSHAQVVLDNISIALREQPTYTCLWKTAADSLCSLHVISKDECKLQLSENLVKMLKVADDCLVTKPVVMEIAEKCYMMAIKFHEDVASLWNDLAVCTYHHGMVLKGQAGEKKIKQSMDIIKKALTLEPDNHGLWNTLGVIAGSPGPSQKVCGHRINDIQNPGLSQHAFIRSLQLNDIDAHVWCNLGTLYLQYDKVMPAHEAFKRAQACDPSVVEAWVGQAIIAECVADEEAMDLFRHATTLAFHGEGSIAYAQWVCRLLKSIASTSAVPAVRPSPDMSHLPAYVKNIVANAAVSLMKSVQRYKEDPCAFNTLGILLEQQALYKQAEAAFASARKLLNINPDQDRQAELLRMVLLNQARVLCAVKRFDDAIEIYKIISLQTVSEYCGLAIAYFSSGQLGKSFEIYEKAFSVSSDDADKSAVLSAIGMVQYAMKDADAAKSYLLKGSQYQTKAEYGVMALAALGLIHGDGTLATAALVELANHKLANTAALVEKQAMLLCAFYLLQGEKTAAQRALTRAIIRYPDNGNLWSRLAKYITENNPNQRTSALHCAKVALLLHPSQETSKTAAFASLAFPNVLLKSKSVQRFVHNHPDIAESWVLLSARLTADATQKSEQETMSVVNMAKLALSKADDSVSQVQETSKDDKLLSMHMSLYSWTMQSYVMVHVLYGDVTTAHMFCNQIIPSLSGDQHKQEQFIFLKGLATMQENLAKNDTSGVENLRVIAALTANDTTAWKWMMLSLLYIAFGMPVCAELSLRRVMQFNMQQNINNMAALYSICLLSMQVYHVSNEQTWLEKAQQVMAELSRVAETEPLTVFLRALLFRMEGKDKAAVKYMQKLQFCENSFLTVLQEKLLEKWK